MRKISNALHLLDALGFAEHDHETVLSRAYGTYVEEHDEESTGEKNSDDNGVASSVPTSLG